MAVCRPRRLVIDDMLLPLLTRLARVLVPGDEVAGTGGAEQVRLAVAVEVADADGPCLANLLVNDEPLPGLALQRLAGVAEPGDVLADPARGGNVEMAVTVEVGEGDVVGPGELLGQDELLPVLAVARRAAVTEPDDLGGEVLDADNVGLAVAVDIADGVPL